MHKTLVHFLYYTRRSNANGRFKRDKMTAKENVRTPKSTWGFRLKHVLIDKKRKNNRVKQNERLRSRLCVTIFSEEINKKFRVICKTYDIVAKNHTLRLVDDFQSRKRRLLENKKKRVWDIVNLK